MISFTSCGFTGKRANSTKVNKISSLPHVSFAKTQYKLKVTEVCIDQTQFKSTQLSRAALTNAHVHTHTANAYSKFNLYFEIMHD